MPLVILERNTFSSSWCPFFHLYYCQLRFLVFCFLMSPSLSLVKIGFKSKFVWLKKKKKRLKGGFCVKPFSLLISVLLYFYLNLGRVCVGLLYVGPD